MQSGGFHSSGTRERLRTWWRSTPNAVRYWTYGLVPTGLLLTGVGLYGDTAKWWERWSYVGNLVTSATTASFGVPTALLILTHLGASMEEARQRRDTLRALQQAESDFCEFVFESMRQRGNDALTTLDGAKTHNDYICSYLEIEADNPGPDGGVADVKHLMSIRKELLSRVFGQPPEPTWAQSIIDQWAMIDKDLRPRLMDLGLPWLHHQLAVKLRRKIGRLESIPAFAFENPDALPSALTLHHSLASSGQTSQLLDETRKVRDWLSAVYDVMNYAHLLEHRHGRATADRPAS